MADNLPTWREWDALFEETIRKRDEAISNARRQWEEAVKILNSQKPLHKYGSGPDTRWTITQAAKELFERVV